MTGVSAIDGPPPPGLTGPSLAEAFQLLRPRVPDALLGGSGWRCMLGCASDLPPAIALSGFSFELGLGSPEPVADLWFPAPLGSAISSHFIDRGQAGDADADAVTLGALFRGAEREGSAISRAIGGIALEYDLARRSHAASPGVFVSPPGFGEDPSTGYTDPDRLQVALAAAGYPEHPGNRRAIRAIFASLPPGASVSHGGLFPAREPAILRVNIAGAEHAHMPSLLDRLGWPGAPGPAAGVVAAFRDLTPCFRLALDVHNGTIGSRLGLEMFQPMSWLGSADSPDAWRRFIGRLEERQWSRPDKAAGLRDWLGWNTVVDSTGAFTEHRLIHHFKFDLRGGEINARAYVFVLYAPMAAGSGRTH